MENLDSAGQPNPGVNRRKFMKMAIATGVIAAAGPRVWAAEGQGEIPLRQLGRTGEKVSCIGLGGSHIDKMKDEQESIRIMRTAIDRGLTFMDNSWDYNDGDGLSETRMGKALRDGYRDKVFLMTKIDGRTKKTANEQLDESLRRLQTDHLDLLQLHEVIRLEDPDRAFADGGAIEALKEARQAGKCRYIRFHRAQRSGGAPPHARSCSLRNTIFISILSADAIECDGRSLSQFPTPSFAGADKTRHRRPRHEIHGQRRHPQKQRRQTGQKCLHYALNLPTSVVITGIDSMKILDQAFEAAKTFKPMSDQEVASLLARTADAAKAGEFELFKTSMKFDSTAQNPKWLGEQEG